MGYSSKRKAQNSNLQFKTQKMIENCKLKIVNCGRPQGYTYIELIITMVILGMLAALFITNFPASQARARDTQRRNDLKQFQISIEAFANKNNGLFPYYGGSNDIKPSVLCTYLGFSSTSDCPDDPKDGQATACSSGLCRYFYQSNGSGALGDASATQYVLWARLEKPDPTTSVYFVVCSNGKSGVGSAAPTLGNCPI